VCVQGTLIVLCAVSAVFFLWFTLACQQYVSNSTLALYFSSVLGGFFLNGSIPLCFELGVETTHPIAEGNAPTRLVNCLLCNTVVCVQASPRGCLRRSTMLLVCCSCLYPRYRTWVCYWRFSFLHSHTDARVRSGNVWANWVLVASCAVALLCMLFFKEHYRRLSVDLASNASLASLAKLQ
jgi:hypothetical protein